MLFNIRFQNKNRLNLILQTHTKKYEKYTKKHFDFNRSNHSLY